MALTPSTFLCALLVLAVVNQSQAQAKPTDAEIAKTLTECGESTGFNAQQLEEKAKAREDLPEEGLCFLKCLAEKMKIVENGKVNEAVIDAMKAEGRVSKSCNAAGATIETCQDIKQFTDCFPSQST